MQNRESATKAPKLELSVRRIKPAAESTELRVEAERKRRVVVVTAN